ncbi:MAG: hypothetical protein ACR2NP_22200 [Pirellulaceae bacterium]
MPRDIEEFLKMAAKRRQQQKQGGGAAPQRSQPATPPASQQRPTPQRLVPRPQSLQPATDEEIIILGPGGQPSTDMRRQSVSDHVRSHIDTSDISEQVSHLGETVGLADDKLDARLHDTFDH